MNSSADQDLPSRPARVRLLTFDWLPFTDDLSASEAVYDAMDRLSADGVFFENHYLQKSGFHGITQGFLSSNAQDDFRGRLLVFGFDTRPAADFASLPDSLNAEFIGSLPVALDLPDDDFCWLHFTSEQSAPAMELEAILPMVDALLEQQCVVFVTSVFGKAQPYGRFETLLAESLVRAPLWVLGTGADCGRVQAVTGSCDVGCTIQQLLRGTVVEASGALSQSSDDEPIDLTTFCSQPGRRLQREVLIEHDSMKAVRSNDFLLVQSPSLSDLEPMECRTALYAKPEDVWNLNDVAGEYQAVVDGLSSRFSANKAVSDSAAPND